MNSTRSASSVSNAWVSWRSFASRFAPVRWYAVPTQVQPISRRRCSGVIVMNLVLPIARPLAVSTVANGTSVPASALARAVSNHARSAGSSMGLAIVQRQIGVVEGDVLELVEVAFLERLEPDARTRRA